LRNIIEDLRYGFRRLLANPGFSFAMLVMLAVGTGANSAMFSMVDAIVLRPLPYEDPDRLIHVWGCNISRGIRQLTLSAPDFLDYQQNNSVFQELAAFVSQDVALTGTGDPERVQAILATSNYFSVFGTKPAMGRTFLAEQGGQQDGRTVVLSRGFWQRRFGSDPNILGKSVLLDGASYTIIGIMPASFLMPGRHEDLWMPMALDGSDPQRIPQPLEPSDLKKRIQRILLAVGKLRPGIPIGLAQREMDLLAARLEQQYPESNVGWSVELVSLRDQLIGQARQAVKLLYAAAGFVLLISCTNLANLLLAGTNERRQEIALRMALGATRLRLVRQLLTESALLSIIGSSLGLLLCWGSIRFLLKISPDSLPRVREFAVDFHVLGFTLIVAILVTFLFGLAPALQGSRLDLSLALKESKGWMFGAGRNRARSIFVVVAVSCAVVLMAGAGLTIRSLYHLQDINPGFNPQNVLTLNVSLPVSRYSDQKRQSSFFQQVLQKVEALPGIQAAGVILPLPLSESRINFSFSIKDRPPVAPGERLRANYRAISPRYFQALGIPVVKGRAFTDFDNFDAPPVAVVNETMRRLYWPGEDPIGRYIVIERLGRAPREIVGVVGDVRHRGLESEAGAEMYLPYLQSPLPVMAFVVRTDRDPISMISAIRSQVWAVDRDQPVYDIKTMEQYLSESMVQPRLSSFLLAIFAAIALCQAAFGIYSVTSYLVSQRVPETGLRMALGAQPQSIVNGFLRQALGLVFLGVVIGVLGAAMLVRFISGFVYGVRALDFGTFLWVSFLMCGIAVAASYIPARKATRLDPNDALRSL